MRIPLTKYGWPQVVIFPAVILAVMVVFLLGTQHQLSLGSRLIGAGLLGAILIWTLMFFRDPERCCPSDTDLLLAPADGQVTDIETVEDPPAFLRASASYDASRGSRRKQEGGGGAALRIGIFLSIFDTHINRAPCNVKVEKITYKKGKYKNAMNPQSGLVNESNDLDMVRTDSPQDRLIVRQISGAIARRIVCDKIEGGELAGGQKFGMIKFGSRTELYLPLRENAKCLVKVGDKVKAGLTPLVKYEITAPASNKQGLKFEKIENSQ